MTVNLKQWEFIVERKRSVLINTIMMHGLSKNSLGDFGKSLVIRNYIYLGGPWFMLKKEEKQYQKRIESVFKKNKSFPSKFHKKAMQIIEKEKKFWNKAEKINFKKISDSRLYEYIRKHIYGLYKINMFLISLVFVESAITSKIKEYLNNKFDSKKADKIFFDLSIPSKESYFEKFNKQIKDAGLNKRKLAKIHSEFKWLKDTYCNWDYFTLDDIRKKAESQKQAVNSEKERKKQKQKFRIALKLLPKRLYILANVNSNLIFLRTYRTDVQYLSFYKLKKAYEEVASKLGLKLADIHWFDDKSLLESIKTRKVDSQIIKKRKKGYGYIMQNNEFRFIYGKELENIKKSFNQIKNKSGKLKGMIAFPGKVKGKVKIVRTNKDANKVKKGDILVASMTVPNFIVAMDKAAAFVTDEGGITCHAAIISREMKKPCIIGTKLATKTFKDGDLVEVNADKGIVKKIK